MGRENLNFKHMILTKMASELDLRPVNDLRDQLLIRLPGIIQRMVMYGSYASGEAGEDSDVDLLVIVDESSPSVVEEIRAARYNVMKRYQYSPLLSLLVLSDEHWQELAKRNAGLKHNVERDGITIWSQT
jgi:hypothetical protein